MTAVALLPGEDTADEKFKETEFQEASGRSLWSQGQNPRHDLFCKPTCALAGAPRLAQTQKGTQVSSHCQASNGHQYPTYHKKYLESSQVKSQDLPNCSLTSSTRAASLSIFSSSSFLWEMSFIRDVDVSMASCSFLWNMRGGQHQWAQWQLPATCKATPLLLQFGLSWWYGSSAPKGALWHHSSPAEGSIMPWSHSYCFVMSSVSHCSTAHGTGAGV